MRRPVILLALVLAAILGAMAAKSLLVQPPALRASNAPGQFDAKRAKGRLAYILGDQRPHPSDTPASNLVRARLIAQLKQIGLTPIVRDQFACNELYKQRGVSCARVRNVIAMLGPPTGKALLLNAHYDSSPVGPGAADDGIGVATLLEVGSILKARPLKRPAILLFNEGEELGLIGARAFLSDPISRNVDAIVNLEARGVRGPVNMFETSRPNAAPVSLFAASVRNPVANSLSTDVYRLMPNYTDVNSFSERDWVTLNLAPIGNETRYHSAGDDIATLDPATVQHMGDQTLALARSLANGTPRADHSNRIFMDVAGRTLIHLPLAVGVLMMAVLALTFALLAIRRKGLLLGAGTVLGTMIGSTALAWLLINALDLDLHGMFWRAEPIWTHLTVYAVTAFSGAVMVGSLGASLDRTQLRPVFWLLLLAVGAAIGQAAPGGVVFFIFPPALALLGMFASRWWQPAEKAGSAAAILFLYLTWGAMLGLLEELLNGGPMWIFAPLSALLIIPLLIEARPLIVASGTRAVSIVSGLFVLLGTGAMLAAPAYSADRQQRFSIQHVSDVSNNKSWWSVLNDAAPLPAAFEGKWKRGKLPFSERPRWIADAPKDPAANAPDVQLLSQAAAGNERTLTLRLVANGNESVSLVAPPDARVRRAGMAGFVRPIDGDSGKYSISCFGRSCDGATVQLTIGQPKPVEFIILGGKQPLPAIAAPLIAGRPRFARPQYNRDEAIAFRTRRL
jgi:hypothetical protein